MTVFLTVFKISYSSPLRKRGRFLGIKEINFWQLFQVKKTKNFGFLFPFFLSIPPCRNVKTKNPSAVRSKISVLLEFKFWRLRAHCIIHNGSLLWYLTFLLGLKNAGKCIRGRGYQNSVKTLNFQAESYDFTALGFSVVTFLYGGIEIKNNKKYEKQHFLQVSADCEK